MIDQCRESSRKRAECQVSTVDKTLQSTKIRMARYARKKEACESRLRGELILYKTAGRRMPKENCPLAALPRAGSRVAAPVKKSLPRSTTPAHVQTAPPKKEGWGGRVQNWHRRCDNPRLAYFFPSENQVSAKARSLLWLSSNARMSRSSVLTRRGFDGATAG